MEREKRNSREERETANDAEERVKIWRKRWNNCYIDRWSSVGGAARWRIRRIRRREEEIRCMRNASVSRRSRIRWEDKKKKAQNQVKCMGEKCTFFFFISFLFFSHSSMKDIFSSTFNRMYTWMERDRERREKRKCFIYVHASWHMMRRRRRKMISGNVQVYAWFVWGKRMQQVNTRESECECECECERRMKCI